MNTATLSPDGHAVAFASPVGGIDQVFLMLTSGGEPLQLTYVSAQEGVANSIWKWTGDGSNPEKLIEKCGYLFDVHPRGNYLLAIYESGENTGIYEVLISERKCVSLLPNVTTFGSIFAPDGKSFLYAVPSRSESTIYRQLWKDGKVIGAPQVALKLPFTFSDANYDFSRDLSTVVYGRTSRRADLYLLSQK
jgi:hypothetical protein